MYLSDKKLPPNWARYEIMCKYAVLNKMFVIVDAVSRYIYAHYVHIHIAYFKSGFCVIMCSLVSVLLCS